MARLDGDAGDRMKVQNRLVIGMILLAASCATGMVCEPHKLRAEQLNAMLSRKEIEAFNKEFTAAHFRMDNAAIVGMWAEDGISLLPETAPMVGKKTIAKFMDDVVAQMPGYHMRSIEIDFQGIEANGEWASEWATEHQIVDAPPGKPIFEGYGKMLLVLHKEWDGNWRIKREMWNQGMKP
jgi:ketosteroid isomerase-like protein